MRLASQGDLHVVHLQPCCSEHKADMLTPRGQSVWTLYGPQFYGAVSKSFICTAFCGAGTFLMICMLLAQSKQLRQLSIYCYFRLQCFLLKHVYTQKHPVHLNIFKRNLFSIKTNLSMAKSHSKINATINNLFSCLMPKYCMHKGSNT